MSRKHAGSFGIFGLILLAAIPANAQGCTLDKLELQCGKKDTAIFSALSSEETSALFDAPDKALDAFKHPSDLEVFRRSVETNWEAVNRVERRERRKMLTRKISAAEFETWTKDYDTARTNYRSALNFYRTLIWYGKTGKPAPVDD